MTSHLRPMVALLRPKQWIKNGFVLAPLLFSGSMAVPNLLIQALIATAFFCIASSAVYVLNDINDAAADRLHPRKSRSRPIAAGQISEKTAWKACLVLFLVALSAYFVQVNLGHIITAYLLLNIAYTYYLKYEPIIDIFCIATGFVLRLAAGAQAISVPLSFWMFITTLCLALFLASIKRRQELLVSTDQSREVLSKYTPELATRFAEISSIGTLIFYSMFVALNRQDLVLSIPLVIFGLFRYWYNVEVEQDGESPTDTLYKDKVLIATVVIWIIICIVAFQTQTSVYV